MNPCNPRGHALLTHGLTSFAVSDISGPNSAHPGQAFPFLDQPSRGREWRTGGSTPLALVLRQESGSVSSPGRVGSQTTCCLVSLISRSTTLAMASSWDAFCEIAR